VLTYYLISLHILTLAFHYCWPHIPVLTDISVSSSSIKSCLHVFIQYVWIFTCVTIVYLTYQSLVTLVLNSDLWTLALCWTLHSSPLGYSNLRLNSKFQTPSYHKTFWNLDFNSWPCMKYQVVSSAVHQLLTPLVSYIISSFPQGQPSSTHLTALAWSTVPIIVERRCGMQWKERQWESKRRQGATQRQ